VINSGRDRVWKLHVMKKIWEAIHFRYYFLALDRLLLPSRLFLMGSNWATTCLERRGEGEIREWLKSSSPLFTFSLMEGTVSRGRGSQKSLLYCKKGKPARSSFVGPQSL